MGALGHGIGFQYSIHPKTFANHAQQCQQCGGEGADQQQTVAAHRFADAGSGQSHAELQILGVAELRFDSPALGVVVDQRGGHRLPQAGGQAPRLLHAFGLHTDDRADLLAFRRDPGIAQFASASALAHPLGRRPGQAQRHR